jgi:hypothetical protein
MEINLTLHERDILIKSLISSVEDWSQIADDLSGSTNQVEREVGRVCDEDLEVVTQIFAKLAHFEPGVTIPDTIPEMFPE